MRLMGSQRPDSGVDLAGQVEQVGANVSSFVPRRDLGSGRGAFAARARRRQRRAQAESAHLRAAAAIPVAACTLFSHFAITDGCDGQSVLINGAAERRTFPCRSRKRSANVTGVCNTSNVSGPLDRRRSRHRLHHRTSRPRAATTSCSTSRQPFVQDHRRAHAGRLSCSSRRRRPGLRQRDTDMLGTLASSWDADLLRFLRSAFACSSRNSPSDDFLELCEAGKVTPVIDRSYR